jgi:hypothetical protein
VIDDDGGFADEGDGPRPDASENRSGLDDRVPISQSLPFERRQLADVLVYS